MKDDERPLSLLGVDGREELSRLFSFDLLLVRQGAALEDDKLAALVHDPCVIALGTSKSDVVHGYLSSIEHVGGARDEAVYYRARLVPFASLMSLGRRSAIYQNMTIPEMVESLLKAYGLADSDFDIHVANKAKSPKHEYIVQYQESDWDFIQRWLEHEGYRYWFTHGAKGVGLVIADSNADATPIEDPHAISFREKSQLGSGEDTIWAFQVRQQRVQKAVTLIDYNYRRPLDLLVAQKAVDPQGFGAVFYYGDHFKENNVGAELAKLRSEELLVPRRTVSGSTDCARFRVGHTFELENHYNSAYDGKYLITSISHVAGHTVPTADEFVMPEGHAMAYRGRFTAIPYKVEYRPAQLTPWPRVKGVMHGHIEADTSGDFAQIDDNGRYKVKLPYDVGTKRGLASSRWIRMAQGYSGSGYGQHMPQHKGTEVLIAHIDGDPDRPVIVGAVPNIATPGPVVGKNATQSVTQTASGIRIELEDRQG